MQAAPFDDHRLRAPRELPFNARQRVDREDRIGLAVAGVKMRHAVLAVVDADDDARSFYRQYGFVALLDDPMYLFLPSRTVEEALTPRERA